MTQKRGVLFAILAAAFYAPNSSLSKLLLASAGPTVMAAGTCVVTLADTP